MISYIRFLFFFFGTTLSSIAEGADHGTFKNCSRVPICTQFRTKKPVDRYRLDISSIYWDNFVAVTGILENLQDSGATNLTFNISQTSDKILRLQIAEVNSSRYQLKDVLVEVPTPKEAFSKVDIIDDQIVITTSDDIIIKIQKSFQITILQNGIGLLDFDGQRLDLTQNITNAPFTFAVKYPQAFQLYGIPQHCDSLALQNTEPGGTDPYRLKNLDVAFYDLNSTMALYGAVPVLYGHGPNGTSGIFLHNGAEQWIEIQNNSGYFIVDTGSLDLFILLGPSPKDVVRQFTTLTGTAHLPPLWSLGYHQSRYSYETQDEVLDVISNFDKHNFPLDAIWLDIDYTDGYKYFTWNPTNFSDPMKLQDAINATNRKLVAVIDPHVKVENGYFLYDNGKRHQLFVRNPDGSDFIGPCWPGISSYLDFLNPNVQEIIRISYSYGNFVNSSSTLAGIWNDMNEPSVFDNSIEMTLPTDLLHDGGVKHGEIHNIYGFLNTMATYNALFQRDNATVRPFVLTRSHFAGSQRYAAIWTGDNSADFQYLAASFKQCLNSNIAGIVFCGADVGGFFGTPSEELLQRWYQAGAWLPFFRGHSVKDVPRREPYLFSEDVQERIRNSLARRYQHLPYWYTKFFEHYRYGDPVIRPLFYQYPEDLNALSIDSELLVGEDILVRVVADSNLTSVKVYFPDKSSVWVSIDEKGFYEGGKFADVPITLDSIPVFYRRGSIIVRKDALRSSSAAMQELGLTLYVIPDENNKAHGTLYLDDTISFDYQNSQDYTYVNIDIDGPTITYTQINPQSTQNFQIIVDQIIYHEILPNQSKAMAKNVFTKDASGKLLNATKIKVKNQFVTQLKVL